MYVMILSSWPRSLVIMRPSPGFFFCLAGFVIEGNFGRWQAASNVLKPSDFTDGQGGYQRLVLAAIRPPYCKAFRHSS